MSVYLFFELMIVLLAALWNIFSVSKSEGFLQGVNAKHYKETLDPTNKSLFILLCLLLIVFLGGFRGDFTADHGGYLYQFLNSNQHTYQELFFQKEFGFKILNKLIRTFTDNTVVFLTVVSSITVYCSFTEMKRNSPYVWLSIFLFLSAGTYYVSFNLMRQILAAGLSLICLRNLYDKKFWKYVLSIIAVSTIHYSAIILIPFYFILQIKWNKRLVLFLSLLYMALLGLTYIYTDIFVQAAQNIFYESYSQSSYGMAKGTGVKTFIQAILIITFVLMHSKCIDFNDRKENIWFNAILFYFLFAIASLKIEMLIRFTYYFVPYLVFLVPRIVSRVKYKEIYMAFIVITLLLYSGISRGVLRSNYLFFWQ